MKNIHIWEFLFTYNYVNGGKSKKVLNIFQTFEGRRKRIIKKKSICYIFLHLPLYIAFIQLLFYLLVNNI